MYSCGIVRSFSILGLEEDDSCCILPLAYCGSHTILPLALARVVGLPFTLRFFFGSLNPSARFLSMVFVMTAE